MFGKELQPTNPSEVTSEPVADTSGTSTPSGTPPDNNSDGLQYFGSRSRWQLLDFRELWRYRELLWMLAIRDLKVRYRQTLVGVAWVVLNPLAMGTIFVVFFSLLGQKPAPGGVPYTLVLLCGLILWQLFATIFAQASSSLVTNHYLIGKVYFPRLLLPLGVAFPSFVDFTIALLLPGALMVYYGVAPSWGIVLLPVFVLLAVMTALALGIWFSALNALYRDAGMLVPLFVQLGFFLSPVVYATEGLIPEAWRPVLALNPMVGALEGFRWSLLGYGEPPVGSVLIGLAVTLLMLLTGLFYFRRIERFLADRI